MNGQIVKERIEQAGVSLSEVARRLSITPQSLQERLSVKDMKIGALYEIARAIGKNISYFLDEYDKELQGNTLQEDLVESPVRRTKQHSAVTTLVDFHLLLKAKDEIIDAQRKTIFLYERLLAETDKSA